MNSKAAVWLLGAVLSATSTLAWAIDWTDVPVVQDRACEFRSSLWTHDTARRHGLGTIAELQAFGIRRAQERCTNGMVLLISSLDSGSGPTREPTLTVARSLCRVEDIQLSQRPSIHQFFFTDVRCVISKIGGGDAPASPPSK